MKSLPVEASNQILFMFFAARFHFKDRCNNRAEDIKQRSMVLKCQSQEKLRKTTWSIYSKNSVAKR